jgi:response regulator NasT
MSAGLVRSLVQTAVAHHQQARALQAELAAAQCKLNDQRLVANAKCRLMEQESISESAAYQRLRRAAMDRGSRIAHIARLLLEQPAA